MLSARMFQQQITKQVKPSSTGAVVYVPKEWIGQDVTIIAPLYWKNLIGKILMHLKDYMPMIVGIYLYGSYARNEQRPDSDVDVLVASTDNFKIDKFDNINFLVVTEKELIESLEKKPILSYPIIAEALPILNGQLLNKLKGIKPSMDFGEFISSGEEKIELCRQAIAKEISKNGKAGQLKDLKVVYTLMLRLRGMFIIETMLNKTQYSAKDFNKHLHKLLQDKELAARFFKVYLAVREDKKIKHSKITLKEAMEFYQIVKNEFELMKAKV